MSWCLLEKKSLIPDLEMERFLGASLQHHHLQHESLQETPADGEDTVS